MPTIAKAAGVIEVPGMPSTKPPRMAPTTAPSVSIGMKKPPGVPIGVGNAREGEESDGCSDGRDL
jgi:hypothetical protein